MRTRRATAIALALLVVALIGLVLPLRPSHRPPVLKLLNIEPAGIFDDAGQMWLITLSISNPDNPPGPVNTLHIRDATNSIQAKLSNQWHAVEGSLNCALRSGDKHECLILVPSDATSCRISLQYAGSTAIFTKQPSKERLKWLAEQLPKFIRFRLPSTVWRWLGYGPAYRPRSDWRAISVEIPLPLDSLAVLRPR